MMSYPMPGYARAVAWLRDVIVLDLPATDRLDTRTAIILDPDNDLRVLDTLFALHAQNRQIRSNLIAIAETQGRITYWYGDPLTIIKSRKSVSEAAFAALYPLDRWQVNDPILVNMVAGVLDRDKLPAHDLLRTVPERFHLGLVRS